MSPNLVKWSTLVGVGVLVFLAGVVSGGMLLGRWFGPAQPELTFATPTPGDTATRFPTVPVVGTVAVETGCPAPPSDWATYVVQAGDTLSELAVGRGNDVDTVLKVNCLLAPDLAVGQSIYLPVIPTPTPCGASVPNGWTQYTVQAGDTLFELAASYGTTVERVIRMNCLAQPELAEGQRLYLPALPTPIPCVISPPSNWGRYIVESGDTLMSLAGARGVSVDDVKRVNCLSSADIYAGQPLYLPMLPTPVPVPTQTPLPTQPPVPTAQAVAALPEPFSPSPDQSVAPPQSFPTDGAIAQAPVEVSMRSSFNSSTNLEPISFVPGRPGGFVACKKREGKVIERFLDDEGQERELWRIHLQGLDSTRPDVVIPGQQITIFACGFREPTSLKAWITYENGRQRPLTEGLFFPLGRDLESRGEVNGAVHWNITCDMPQGEYTLNLRYINPIPDPVVEVITQTHRFKLEKSDKRRTLVVPQAARVGSAFEVNYCNYPPNTSHEVTLYREEWDETKQEFKYVPVDTWTITTNRKGWAKQLLRSLPNDPPSLYVVNISEGTNQSADDIWLFK